MNRKPAPRRALTSGQAGQYLGYTVGYLADMRRELRGPAWHRLPSGHVRYWEDDLARYLAGDDDKGSQSPEPEPGEEPRGPEPGEEPRGPEPAPIH